MSRSLGAGVLLLSLSAVAPLDAQMEEAERIPLQIGRLELAPTVRLFNVGLDGNVFKDAQGAARDATATLQPAVNARIQLGRAQVTARGELAYVHYKSFRQLNSLETNIALRAEGRVNRLTPYVVGSLQRGRHREDYEIDSHDRRQNVDVAIGADAALTERLALGAGVVGATERYATDAAFGGSNLAEQFNRTTTGERLAVRYRLTPLTTISMVAERDRARFSSSPERNADSVRIGPVVEFNPLALVNGRVAVAYRERSFHAPGVESFTGTAVRMDLGYVFRESTRVTIAVDRDLAYSYRTAQDDYVRTTVATSVARQLSDDWDATLAVGRTRLTYLSGSSAVEPRETVLEYRGILGAKYGTLTRVTFEVGYRTRASWAVGRDYGRLTATTSVAYSF